jgi:hypothetical protein
MSIYEFIRWNDDYVMSMILWYGYLWYEHLCTWAWAWARVWTFKWKRWYNSGSDELTSHYRRRWPVRNGNGDTTPVVMSWPHTIVEDGPYLMIMMLYMLYVYDDDMKEMMFMYMYECYEDDDVMNMYEWYEKDDVA